MTTSEWLVCESTGRWAAALRREIARKGSPRSNQQRLCEIRSLSELKEQLLQSGDQCLALVEVRPANLGEVLALMSECSLIDSQLRFVGLLDCRELHASDLAKASDAVRAAGAVATTDSPRQLQHIVQLGNRHAVLMQQAAQQRGENRSFSEWAHSRLPWQEIAGRLG